MRRVNGAVKEEEGLAKMRTVSGLAADPDVAVLCSRDDARAGERDAKCSRIESTQCKRDIGIDPRGLAVVGGD